jgi:hypothetical protein
MAGEIQPRKYIVLQVKFFSLLTNRNHKYPRCTACPLSDMWVVSEKFRKGRGDTAEKVYCFPLADDNQTYALVGHAP